MGDISVTSVVTSMKWNMEVSVALRAEQAMIVEREIQLHARSQRNVGAAHRAVGPRGSTGAPSAFQTTIVQDVDIIR